MRPDDFGFYEEDLADDESLGKERPEFYPQFERLGFEEISLEPAFLRNGNAGELQPVPGCHADLPQVQGSIESLAEFLLNAMVRALRLDIQIHPKQNHAGQRHGSSKQPKQIPAHSFHSGTLRSVQLKKR